MVFNCKENCGLCCEHVAPHPDVESVDGVCVKFDKVSRKCSDYENRPLICRVCDGYSFFKDQMTEDEYLEANYRACRQLMAMFPNDSFTIGNK